MKIITIEEHFTTRETIKIIQDYNASLPNQDALKLYQTDMNAGMLACTPEPGEMTDMGDNRIAYMDTNGIDMQIVSAAGITPQLLPADQAVSASRALNEALKKAIDIHPDRFAGLACLPLQDPEAAVKELTYSVEQLGLKGALISGTVDGTFLDDPKFLPVFAKAAELDVPIYLHPGYPTKEATDVLYKSNAYSGAVKSILSTPGFGWHMEAGIDAIRLIFSGVFDKYPNLKIISGHWGEFVPMFLNRLDEMTAPVETNLEHPFTYYYHNNVFIDPSGMFETDTLLYNLNRIGADHIMWAEDYPFVKTGKASQFLADLPISQINKEKMGHETAEKLFKL